LLLSWLAKEKHSIKCFIIENEMATRL
jgi:hypothetical protein